ncbi:MAG: hypothetical protein QMD86_00955 [Patescibacteria group bacterium]|nr:hypothetical protein [Patescibacteria group bacterium]
MNNWIQKIIEDWNLGFGYYSNILPVLNVIALVISGILLWFVVYLYIKLDILGKKVRKYEELTGVDVMKKFLRKAWTDIIKKINSGNDIKAKNAVQDADKILNEVLKLNGFMGKNINERLIQLTEKTLPNCREVIHAHSLCEKAKDEDFTVTSSEAKNICLIYQKAFKHFGLLD